MSQKSAPSVPARARVSGGVPLWLWLILVVFGAAIIATFIRKSIPEDPALYFQQAMAAVEAGDAVVAQKNIQKLKRFPEYSAKQTLLEGMVYLGTSKPLLAIPLLQDAAKDAGVRIQALSQLGNAFLRSGRRADCIGAYETALQEDENADDVRFSLANVLKEILNWDESLKHLKILQNHSFRLGIVHTITAEIYSEMGRFSEAATEYEAALRADPTDAANSRKAIGLFRCRIESGDLKGLEEFLPLVDSEGIRNSYRALELVAKNDSEQALAAFEDVPEEDPGHVIAIQIYGQIVAETGSKEKAVETLKNLRTPLEFNARNLRLFEVMASLATIVEEEELAAALQQNIDQLKDQESQFLAKLNEVVKTRDDTQARFQLGDLAAGIGRPQLAQLCYQSASLIDSSLESATQAKVLSLYGNPLPLVSVEDAFIKFETDDPATETDSGVRPESETAAEAGAVSPNESATEKTTDSLPDASSERNPE